ncbi:TetR/AcrR family transcriptional regulator [Streptomyces malaysiensis]|uniref:TetR/AcrR family transcriptional regulator n=1 Tax=Streptomyces malaysiensis TaxID=92644 RepID=UPI000C2C605E|nr:TetR/AcrR family transcriptional regulator [Streptomyces sp. M56]MYX59718.1 TetR family transcriptional regulator [Streptomyces sp. SID8382]
MAPRSPAQAAQTRQRIIEATSALLTEGGPEALSTRAICAAAGVQPPTIYRLFGDKQGLIDAVAAHGMEVYLAGRPEPDAEADPIEALRLGWDEHVGFGLANAALYVVVFGTPRSHRPSPTARATVAPLAARIHNIAQAGKLRVSEHLAVEMVFASGCGTVLTLLATPEDERDLTLSDAAREAVLAAITVGTPRPIQPGIASTAIALRAMLDTTDALTSEESALLRTWLTRIAQTG